MSKIKKNPPKLMLTQQIYSKNIIKTLILVLGLLQVVGTVKSLNYRLCLHKFVEM